MRKHVILSLVIGSALLCGAAVLLADRVFSFTVRTATELDVVAVQIVRTGPTTLGATLSIDLKYSDGTEYRRVEVGELPLSAAVRTKLRNIVKDDLLPYANCREGLTAELSAGVPCPANP